MIRLLNEPFFLPTAGLLPALSYLRQTDERTLEPLAQASSYCAGPRLRRRHFMSTRSDISDQ